MEDVFFLDQMFCETPSLLMKVHLDGVTYPSHMGTSERAGKNKMP